MFEITYLVFSALFLPIYLSIEQHCGNIPPNFKGGMLLTTQQKKCFLNTKFEVSVIQNFSA